MKYFLISEATRYVNDHGLAYSSGAIRGYIKTGQIPAIQTIGGTRVVNEKALKQFIADKQKKIASKLQNAA